MNLSKLKRFSSKGFTLIELLIVIAILGVLAAAVLVAINPGQRIAAARNARVRSDLSNAGSAANIFNADTGLASGCESGGSYPKAWADDATATCGTGAKFMARPKDPAGTDFPVIKVDPSGCGATVANKGCTSIAIEAPAYSDGTIDATTNTVWCWRSSTGSVAQTTSALCTAP